MYENDIKNIEYETDQYINIFTDDEGEFGFCLSGTTDGLLWETEDQTGFATIEEAEQAAREFIELT